MVLCVHVIIATKDIANKHGMGTDRLEFICHCMPHAYCKGDPHLCALSYSYSYLCYGIIPGHICMTVVMCDIYIAYHDYWIPNLS